ncbi:MAG: hypothetical protein HND57_08590 [Planctomycetes bacterium]|nr:hypothetical protein [Planctomycetota bacterium]
MRYEDFSLAASDAHPGDWFGYTVCIDDNIAVVGAPGHDGVGLQAGAAYIFRRSDISGWTEEAVLFEPNGSEFDLFGTAVGVSGDRVIIGVPGAEMGRGAVYVYHHSLSHGWQEEATLVASDRSTSAEFGEALSIDGGWILIGAPGHTDYSGAAYIFRLTADGTWIEDAKLMPSKREEYTFFGHTVSLDCDVAVVGADHTISGPSLRGSVYIYRRSNEGAWSEEDRLRAWNENDLDFFGCSICVNHDRLLVGSMQDPEGSLPGYAYLWVYQQGIGWQPQQRLEAYDGEQRDEFGSSVSIDGRTAIIGSCWDDDNGTSSGSAYVFHLTDGQWREQEKLIASDGQRLDWLGEYCSVSKSSALIASRMNDSSAGKVYGYDDISPLSLALEGECPGNIRCTIFGADPDDRLVVLYGTQQGKTEALPYCPDLFINIAIPIVAAVGLADTMGELTVTGKVPGKACGRLIVQGVNLTTCEKTKATLLE